MEILKRGQECLRHGAKDCATALLEQAVWWGTEWAFWKLLEMGEI